MTNNQFVLLTQLICVAGVFVAPNLYISLMFFILCHIAVFNYVEDAEDE